MEPLQIAVLGRFQVRRRHDLLPGFEPAKVQELLAYLILFRDRPVSREALVAHLWNEGQPGRGRGYLRKALWQLQKSLNDELGTQTEDVLVVEPDWVQLRSNSCVDADSAKLEQIFAATRDIPGSNLNETQRQQIECGIDLYRGDLLEGCYTDWCLIERQRLQLIFLTLLDKLIESCLGHGDHEAGITYCYQILRCDRARERTHRQLMRLHFLAGNRTDALRQYDLCQETLAEELGVCPSPRTTQLYEQLCEGEMPATEAAVQPNAIAVREIMAALPQVCDALSQTKLMLEQLASLSGNEG